MVPKKKIDFLTEVWRVTIEGIRNSKEQKQNRSERMKVVKKKILRN